jgi:hypothetical protein
MDKKENKVVAGMQIILILWTIINTLYILKNKVVYHTLAWAQARGSAFSYIIHLDYGHSKSPYCKGSRNGTPSPAFIQESPTPTIHLC